MLTSQITERRYDCTKQLLQQHERYDCDVHLMPSNVYLLSANTVDCTLLRAVLPPLLHPAKLYPLLCRACPSLLADVLLTVALLRKVDIMFYICSHKACKFLYEALILWQFDISLLIGCRGAVRGGGRRKPNSWL
jgi:hypothetical protein